MATLQEQLPLTVDEHLTVKSPLKTAGEYEFQLEVPLDREFSELAIFAQINDFSEVTNGLELYANIGNEKTLVPNKASHDVAGKSIFWGGNALFFSRKDFSAQRNIIKIFMTLSADMEVKLYTQLTKDNDYTVKLGQTIFEFVSPDSPKTFYLDLSREKWDLGDKTIALEFITYAGAPQFQVAFDKDFKTEIEGKHSFSTMTYLIT